MEIEDICRKARAEGLSYGQYVYVHAAELAGKRPVQRLRAGERSCRHCGRTFLPSSNRHSFCRTACRVAWNQEKRRRMMKKEAAEIEC